MGQEVKCELQLHNTCPSLPLFSYHSSLPLQILKTEVENVDATQDKSYFLFSLEPEANCLSKWMFSGETNFPQGIGAIYEQFATIPSSCLYWKYRWSGWSLVIFCKMNLSRERGRGGQLGGSDVTDCQRRSHSWLNSWLPVTGTRPLCSPLA